MQITIVIEGTQVNDKQESGAIVDIKEIKEEQNISMRDNSIILGWIGQIISIFLIFASLFPPTCSRRIGAATIVGALLVLLFLGIKKVKGIALKIFKSRLFTVFGENASFMTPVTASLSWIANITEDKICAAIVAVLMTCLIFVLPNKPIKE